MNVENLTTLADLLDENANNKTGVKFDLKIWGSVQDMENPVSCGTTACAMGLAAISGKFPELSSNGVQGYISFKYNGEELGGFSSATRLFDISHLAAEYLFAKAWTPNNGEGAKAERWLANVIRKFIELEGDLPNTKRWNREVQYAYYRAGGL